MKKLKKDMLLFNKHGESFKYVGEGKMPLKLGEERLIPSYILISNKTNEYLSIDQSSLDYDYTVFEPTLDKINNCKNSEELYKLTLDEFIKIGNFQDKELKLNNKEYYTNLLVALDVFIESYFNMHYKNSIKDKIYHKNMKQNFEHLMICFFITWEMANEKKKKEK